MIKRTFLISGIALLACSTVDRIRVPFSDTEPIAAGLTPAAETFPTPTIDPAGRNVVYVAPFCTLLGEDDTHTEAYGDAFELSWGWKALTRRQVLDYLESAVTKVTFDGGQITDAKRTEVYGADGEYHVFWEKDLGVLARGKYVMTFFEKYTFKIFDGWEYFGPGTDAESVEDTCYLIVE